MIRSLIFVPPQNSYENKKVPLLSGYQVYFYLSLVIYSCLCCPSLSNSSVIMGYGNEKIKNEPLDKNC
jgi:hypothetical protein